MALLKKRVKLAEVTPLVAVTMLSDKFVSFRKTVAPERTATLVRVTPVRELVLSPTSRTK